MKGSAISIDTAAVNDPIRCDIELTIDSYRLAGVARVVSAYCLQVQVPRSSSHFLAAGQIVELSSSQAPLGPIAARARVVSVREDADAKDNDTVSATLDLTSVNDADRSALSQRLAAFRPMILAVGTDEALEAVTGNAGRIVVAEKPRDALARLNSESIALLVFGADVEPTAAADMIEKLSADSSGFSTLSIVLNAGSSPELFQRFIDQDRIFYLARGPIEPCQLRAIVKSALERIQSRGQSRSEKLATRLAGVDGLLEFCLELRRQADFNAAAQMLLQTVQRTLDADRAHLLTYDAERDVLHSTDPVLGEVRSESAASGLIGYVVRTGEGVCVERAIEDSRFDPEADDPGSEPIAHFVAEPIRGPRGEPIGVLAAVRNGASVSFSPVDAGALRTIAECASPVLSSLLLQNDVQACLVANASGVGTDVFRQEALEHHGRHAEPEGSLIAPLPTWIRRAHWLALVLVTLGLCYVMLARVQETAAGPALIRARNRSTISANTGGLVRAVEVSAGSRVRRGEPLVGIESVPGATTELLRAPADGVVSVVRVRTGQSVTPGEQVASIVDDTSGYEVITFLPGPYAPQLHAGMRLALRLQGYEDAYQLLLLGEPGGQVFSPQEAARLVGRDAAEMLSVGGPVVLVSAPLPSTRFQSEGQSYAYRDGMIGQAEVAVRSTPIIFRLVPGLKALLTTGWKSILGRA